VGAPGLVQAIQRDPDLHGGPPILLCQRSACRAAASTRAARAALTRSRAGPLASTGSRMQIRPGAGLAEWQTRQTQNLLPVREWGFKSLHPHQLKVAHSATQALEKRYLGHLCGKIAGGGGALCRNLHQRITADGWP